MRSSMDSFNQVLNTLSKPMSDLRLGESFLNKKPPKTSFDDINLDNLISSPSQSPRSYYDSKDSKVTRHYDQTLRRLEEGVPQLVPAPLTDPIFSRHEQNRLTHQESAQELSRRGEFTVKYLDEEHLKEVYRRAARENQGLQVSACPGDQGRAVTPSRLQRHDTAVSLSSNYEAEEQVLERVAAVLKQGNRMMSDHTSFFWKGETLAARFAKESSANATPETTPVSTADKLKSKPSVWFATLRSAKLTGGGSTEQQISGNAVRSDNKLSASIVEGLVKEQIELFTSINLARCKRNVDVLELSDDLNKEAHRVANQYDAEVEETALSEGEYMNATYSEVQFDEETGLVEIFGPSGFDGSATGGMWISGESARHQPRNHSKAVGDAILEEHCPCHNFAIHSSIVDETWRYVGFSRTETDERWVVLLSDREPGGPPRPMEELNKLNTLPMHENTPFPQRNPYEGRYSVLSPYEWDSEEDAEGPAVQGAYDHGR